MATFTTSINQIESLYVGYFGRAGDPAGVNYWIGQMSALPSLFTLKNIAISFAFEPEAKSKYPYLANPNIADPGQFVDQVYLNMFNHVADPAGKAYWVGQLQQSGGSPFVVGEFILNVISVANGLDSITIANKVVVAADFTTKAANAGTTWTNAAAAQSSSELASVNDTADSVTAARAATDAFIASAPGPQSMFTLGQDNLTASAQNANFNAPLIFNPPSGTLVQSLQSGNSAIDTAPPTGPGLSNGGIFTGMLDGLAPNVILRNIPTHSVTNVGGGIAGYSGTITGATTIINNNSIGGLTIGALGAGIDAGGIAGTTTTGATLLNSVIANNTAGGATTVFVNSAALSGSSDGLRINTTGTFGTSLAPNTISVKTDTSAAGAAMNGYETLDVNAAGTTFLRLADPTSGIASTTTITVAGAGATSLFGEATEAHFTKLTTIDASTQTGGLTVTGALTAGGLLVGNTVLSSFKGGAGADSLDLSSLLAAQLGAFTSGNLDGGTGTIRDTLILSTAAATTTTAINNSNFEIVGIFGLTGTIDFSKYGAGVDTFSLVSGQAGAATFNNLTSGLTVALGTFASGSAGTFASTGTALTDVISITSTATAAGIGAEIFTGFETINQTMNNAAFVAPITSITATPSAGGAVIFNFIDNSNALTGVATTTNLGPGGTLNISGTGTGGVSLVGTLTAGALNASGLNTGAAAATIGVSMGSAAASTISILGSNGADTLVGSTAADTISGGAGNDTITNLAAGAGGVGVFDQITGGTGVDQVFIRGDVAAGALPALYSAVTNYSDMTVGTGAVGTTDFITVSATATNYAVNIGAGGLQAATTTQGTWTIQTVASGQADAAVAVAANELIKFTTSVSTAGLTLQTAFNAAIGATLLTAATADGSYFFTMYDSTNSRMDIGIVNASGGTNTNVEAGDVVALVGSVNMSVDDYANIGANHFRVIGA